MFTRASVVAAGVSSGLESGATGRLEAASRVTLAVDSRRLAPPRFALVMIVQLLMRSPLRGGAYSVAETSQWNLTMARC
jgi:hypothetical protein